MTIKMHYVERVDKDTSTWVSNDVDMRPPCAVAIIGTGFAGLAAAIEAANQLPAHESVVLIEKMLGPGGNSIMNAGQIAAVGTVQQELDGIRDSVDLMMHDMLKAGVDLNHPELIRKIIEESNDMVKWTEDELGIQYRTRVTQLGGHSVPRTLSTLNASGYDIISPMLNKIRKMDNIQMLLNTEFKDFVTSDDGRSVLGIRTMNRTTNQVETMICTHGVILASGGFSADIPFRSIQVPTFDEKVLTTNQPGATAEVIKEAMKIGAMTVQLDRIQLGPWTSPDEVGFGKAPFFCIGAGFPYGIIVDPHTSKRFVNELGNRYERSMAILKLGHPVLTITDNDGAMHSLTTPLQDLEPAVRSFKSLQELAEEYGMDYDVFADTINRYNEGVEEGKDEFGKPFRKDLKKIFAPPFYATRLWPKVHHTMGGLHINSNAQVIHIDGFPIGGLYAAGEVAGGVHGGDRLGSCATLDCIAFGRIAGRTAAQPRLTPEEIGKQKQS